MKFYIKKYFLIVVAAMVAFSCSTKKNTWGSRTYQSFTTKYNVKFNAQTQFDEGVKTLKNNHKDDYSTLLPMFPVVNQETGGSISGQMNTTIEKARKAIKNHSIRKKPTKKPLRMSNQQYQIFKNQEEFNTQIKHAWLLLGKASFYKADFIGAVGDLNYLIRHFPEATAVVYEAKLWLARAYAEMGWLYEAENELQNLNENTLPTSLNGTFAAFKADILLKQERYKEAIPFLLVAIDKEKDKYYVARWEFILGQLYRMTGQENLATQHFMNAKRKAQNYEMIFNASLRAFESEKNVAVAIKGLQKMAKNSNNKNYLDQIYFAIGNQYLKNNNEPKAIEYYKLAMEKSTRHGLEKALVALKLGDLYYKNREYILSAPLYDSVVKMMPSTHLEYKRAENLAEVLGELVLNYNVVQLQDSLLNLSLMSESEQLKVAEKIIANLIAQEKQAAKDSADRAALAVAQNFSNTPDGFDPMPGMGGRNADWYFYNASLVSRGKREFETRWGRRALEDNWRRQNRVLQMTMDTEYLAENDSISTAEPTTNDRYDPAYYLAQIPKTEEQKNAALAQVATALYNMGGVFNEKLKDDEMADETYRTFQFRFFEDERKCETYYYNYQINGRLGNTFEQDSFREKILTECSDSKFAVMLRDPNYAQKMAEMLLAQDSIYEATYLAYSKGDFASVRRNYNYVLQNFPLSELLPKFTFLNALTIGKTGERDDFEQSLSDLIERYPDSDVATMSRDILALMRQGREASNDGGASSLVEMRNQEAAAEIENIKQTLGNFTAAAFEPQSILIIQNDNDRMLINNMLYDIAAYNFNKFMIKDFDFDIKKIDRKDILIISGMESLEEANWYKNLLFTDNLFIGKDYLNLFNVIIISDSNLRLIEAGKSLDEYLRFSGK